MQIPALPLKALFTWTASGSLDLYWVSCTADTLLKSNCTVLDGKRPLEWRSIYVLACLGGSQRNSIKRAIEIGGEGSISGPESLSLRQRLGFQRLHGALFVL
jgi:hypothetical protein